jgi:FKBP-type peptidyl-prolyl cis-trans isomerase
MKRFTWFLLLVVIAVGCNETAVTLTADEQLVYDVNIIDQYLAENSVNAVKHESGIRYVITETGTGPTPTKDNCVKYHYAVSFLYEPEAFQRSRSEAFKIPMKNQITGMQIGLKQFPVGSKGSIYIPSGLAYGPNPGVSAMPRNAILRYDIEVLSVSAYNALGDYCYE